MEAVGSTPCRYPTTDNPVAVVGSRLSHHARARMDEMGLTPADVTTAILEAELDYDQSDRGPNRRVAQGPNGVTVVYAADTGTIITVLWRTNHEYTGPRA